MPTKRLTTNLFPLMTFRLISLYMGSPLLRIYAIIYYCVFPRLPRPDQVSTAKWVHRITENHALTENKLKIKVIWEFSSDYSTLDKQRICVYTQLKSSNKQFKLNVCILKSNSVDRYAITCDVIAYHSVHFVSIWVIYKCQSGIDFFLLASAQYNSNFMNKYPYQSSVLAENETL